MAVPPEKQPMNVAVLPAPRTRRGDWNWYLPSWLEWLPDVGTEGSVKEPQVEAPAALGTPA